MGLPRTDMRLFTGFLAEAVSVMASGWWRDQGSNSSGRASDGMDDIPSTASSKVASRRVSCVVFVIDKQASESY